MQSLTRILRIGRIAVFLFAAASFAQHEAQAQIAVGDGGTPSYSQAIAVPPGVGGMAPKLSLFYAGGGVNGPVGHGWSVQGISVITRCAATLAQDGRRAGVTYGASDKLCLDGQRLIQTDESGNPAPAGGNNAAGVAVTTQANDAQGLGNNLYREFRTEKDTYARIRAYGKAKADDATGASGPAYFRVWTKAGQVYEYGQGPASNSTTSALIAAPGKAPMAWAVARISDTLGNFIDFKYKQRPVAWGSGPGATPIEGHEWNVLELQYSGNKVIFNYDVDAQDNDLRTDKSEAYHQGVKSISSRRLASITTYVNSPPSILGPNGGVAVRTTKLSYENGPITGRSRVEKIQECSGGIGSTRCLPYATFSYSSGGNEAYQPNAAFGGSSLATLEMIGTGTTGALLGDFNGDGKTDILYWSQTPANNKLYTSNGDGNFAQNSNFNITAAELFKNDGCFLSIAADFNGDGVTDVLRIMRATQTSGSKLACTGAVPGNILYLGSATGSFSPVTVPASIDLSQTKGETLEKYDCAEPKSATYTPLCEVEGETYLGTEQKFGANFHLLDVNGDGFLDIVTTILPGFSQTTSPPAESAQCASIVCTHVYLGSSSGTFSEISTNLAHHSVYAEHMERYVYFRKPYVADFNGDGLQDMRVATGLWLSNGDGSFSYTPTDSYKLACANPIDFNGDGRSDCINGAMIVSNQSLTIGDGTLASPSAANFNLKSPGQELYGRRNDINFGDLETVGIVVADINGDGRQDILRWKDAASQNVVYLSNGDGSFTQSTSFNLADRQLQNSDGFSVLLMGDFTGKGSPEFLRLMTAGGTPSNQLLTKLDSTPPDQLIGVTSPSGLKSTLYYVPLSNSTPLNGVSDVDLGARYQSDLGDDTYAVAGAVHLIFPSYVVATQVDKTGVGTSEVVTEMSYRGLKADRKGRGILGFREVLRQRPGADGSPLTVGTQYVQTHPYIGVAASTSTYRSKLNATSSSTWLSSTSNVYCDQTNAGAASASVNCPVAAKVVRPYLFRSIESGQDLNGNALPTVTTQNAFNGSGDPTAIQVTTTGTVAGVLQTFTKSVVNSYGTNDTGCTDFQTCRWILGRLSQSTVTNTVPNSLSSIASSAGNGLYATATAGSGPAVSSPLTLVLSNCASTTPTISPTPATYRCQLGNSGTSNASNITYASSLNSLVVSGPASCAANTTNCGNVTMQSPAIAGMYAGKFNVSSMGASVTSANITLNVSAPGGLSVSTASFNPTSVTAGGSSSFSWSTTNATAGSVSCTGTGVTVSGTPSGTSGMVTVGTTTATTAANCTITASAASGAMVSSSADLTVVPAGAVNVNSASFSPTSVSAGGSSTFSWSATNATSASVSCSGAGASATGSGVSGSISVSTSSAGTATCTVTASDGSGGTATGSANLAVSPSAPVITGSSFNVANLNVGGTSIFSWSVSNATSSSASCTGAISGSGSGTATGGSLTATAGATFGAGTCTVTATGAGGTTTGSRTINVVSPITTASFSPTSVTAGQSSTFTWVSANGTSANVSCSGAGSSATSSGISGSFSYPTSAAGTATCSVTAGDGSGAVANLTVNAPVAAPSITARSFNVADVTAGGAATFTWSVSNATSSSASCSGAISGSGSGNATGGSLTATAGASQGTGTCTVTATGAGGTSNGSSTVNVVLAPSTTGASFSPATVTSGGASQLCWNSANTTRTTVSCSSQYAYSWDGAQNGEVCSPANISTSGTGAGSCTITSYNAAGATTTTGASINVVAPPSVSGASFSPTSVTAGSASTFSWSTSNASSASVSCSGAGASATGSGTSGSITVGTSSAGTATCTVTAANSAGATATSSATLTVPAPAAPSITARSFNVASVTAGGAATFSWSASNATSTSASCSGAISGSGSGTASGGSLTATAGASQGTGTCTVTATGPGGTSSGSSTITVVLAPSTTGASFSPATVTSGGTSQLCWNSANTTRTTVSCSSQYAYSWDGAQNGQVCSPSNTPTSGTGAGSCTITSYNAAGATTTTGASINVVAPPSVSSASFNASYVTAGSAPTFSWSTVNASSASVSCSGAGASATGSGTSGSINVGTSIAGTATCTVTAANSAGSTATGSASIVVNPAAALTFTVSGPAGSTWTFTNPNSSAQTVTGLDLQFGASGNTMLANISGGSCTAGGTVAPGASCTVSVRAPNPDCKQNNYVVMPVLSTAAGSVGGSWLYKQTNNTMCQ